MTTKHACECKLMSISMSISLSEKSISISTYIYFFIMSMSLSVSASVSVYESIFRYISVTVYIHACVHVCMDVCVYMSQGVSGVKIGEFLRSKVSGQSFCRYGFGIQDLIIRGLRGDFVEPLFEASIADLVSVGLGNTTRLFRVLPGTLCASLGL